MASNNDPKDIEIIPPDEARRREKNPEWVYISFDSAANPFRTLPLHKRILLGAAWLASLLAVGVIVFLIVASAVLIWIPLLLAAGVITALVVFFRTKFRRR
jgi:hypothetical protein